LNVKLFGRTSCGYQRYRCKICKHTYTFHNRKNKEFNERKWFELWIVEGYSARQLVSISRRGIWKIKQILSFWMNKAPDKKTLNYHQIKYLLFDGTYFKHENCLMVLIDNSNGKIVNHKYCIRENYEYARSIFEESKSCGIMPMAITVDGNTSVMRAIKDVWPDIIIQRCLAHIQRQGLSWLRRNPKLEASKKLRDILLSVTKIKNERGKKIFLNTFQKWERKYGKSVNLLSSKDKVFSDLKATRNLLINALPSMFHYLKDKNIPSTTNKIEGYFSRLKIIYRQHRGLLKGRRKDFFKWYIYFKN